MHKPNQIPNIAESYSARIMLTIENGKVTSERMIGDGEILATIETFIELAQRAGWHVSPKRPEQEVANVA